MKILYFIKYRKDVRGLIKKGDIEILNGGVHFKSLSGKTLNSLEYNARAYSTKLLEALRVYFVKKTNSPEANPTQAASYIRKIGAINTEIERRGNSAISKLAILVSVISLATAVCSFVLTMIFSYLDFKGDKEWQDSQIDVLQKIEQTLTEKNTVGKKRNVLDGKGSIYE